MGRKGKTQKHTAKEIAAKHKKAKEKRGAAGGGGSGAAARKAKGAKVSVICEVCKAAQPNFKSMCLHFENKHTKLPFPKEEYEQKFNAVRGSHVKEGQMQKGKKAKGKR
eukprot:g1004.t1